jgi:hypothetical protein
VWFTLSVPPLEPVQQQRRHTKTWGKLFKGAFSQLPSGSDPQQNLGLANVNEDSRSVVH